MHPALKHLDHRPWPLPKTAWAWRQSWVDLAFAHWPVDVEQIRPLIPAKLEIDTFDGTAWIGLVPFRMSGVMRRPLPDMPWVSAFPELNVRTYVTYRNKPGVWFFSLDAPNPLAIWAAKKWFHLPYYRSTISIRQNGDQYQYNSQRSGNEKTPANFKATYGPTSDVYHSKPGTLEHWLTERYCLYAQAPSGVISCTEVHHPPWPLQKCEMQIEENSLCESIGLKLDEPPHALHFSQGVDTVVWQPGNVD
ncbi:MAG: hypothetical protein COA78_02765 [Blastopirellula sp.]|nr:MAG: hypothetical protein COA78_02765 [Blastopirellula sp.]